MVHAPKINMESNPFLTRPSTLVLTSIHHSKKDRLFCGAKVCRLNICNTPNQTCREKTHATSRWSAVSSTWSQRGQAAGWGRPFLAMRSAVQILLRAAVHRKNLHLPGAQLFQICFQGPKSVAPMDRSELLWLSFGHTTNFEEAHNDSEWPDEGREVAMLGRGEPAA